MDIFNVKSEFAFTFNSTPSSALPAGADAFRGKFPDVATRARIAADVSVMFQGQPIESIDFRVYNLVLVCVTLNHVLTHMPIEYVGNGPLPDWLEQQTPQSDELAMQIYNRYMQEHDFFFGEPEEPGEPVESPIDADADERPEPVVAEERAKPEPVQRGERVP
jgi:hypothetical protein